MTTAQQCQEPSFGAIQAKLCMGKAAHREDKWLQWSLLRQGLEPTVSTVYLALLLCHVIP